ncbi:MAG: helix-turn-helix domain-containing protein [Actinomycetota bacterium]|nr:helix-turn-helix domain-containing protein [Actinomycetota bacterium]
MSRPTRRPKPRFTDQDYRDILAFRDQLRRFLAWSEAQAKAAGLTPAHHQLLLAVRGHPSSEPPTIGDLAEHLQLQHHSAVGLVDRAEAAGLVKRVPDPHERRIARVVLQPTGLDALEQLTALHLAELTVLAETTAGLRIPRPPRA